MLCTQCGHSNPDGASHCASCAAPLPTMSPCPSCQELVSADACFCAHCGTSLQSTDLSALPSPASEAEDSSAGDQYVPPTEVVDLAEAISMPSSDIPATDVVNPAFAIRQPPDLLVDDDSELQPISEEQRAEFTIFPEVDSLAAPSTPDVSAAVENPMAADRVPDSAAGSAVAFDVSDPLSEVPSNSLPTDFRSDATQIQQPMAYFVHVRSDTTLSIPVHLDIVHLGKPNDRVPPDIDVSGFPDSDVVSRVHADLRLEADGYYLQDSGSANGTYVNNQALRTGDRYRLRTGDRISLGKEDKVSFIFHAG
jgi:hypothetical protein